MRIVTAWLWLMIVSLSPVSAFVPDPLAELRDRAAAEEAAFAAEIESHAQLVRELSAMRGFMADRTRLSNIRPITPEEQIRERNSLRVQVAANTLLLAIDWSEFDGLTAEYLKRWSEALSDPATRVARVGTVLAEYTLKVSLIKPDPRALSEPEQPGEPRPWTEEEVRAKALFHVTRLIAEHRNGLSGRISSDLHRRSESAEPFPAGFDYARAAGRLRSTHSLGYSLRSESASVASLKLELLDLSDQEIEKRMVEASAVKAALEAKGAYRTGSVPVLKSRATAEADFAAILGDGLMKSSAVLQDGSLVAVGDVRKVGSERLASLPRWLQAEYLLVREKAIHGVAIRFALGERAHSGTQPTRIPFDARAVPGTAFESYVGDGAGDRLFLESPSMLISITRGPGNASGKRPIPITESERARLIEMVSSVIELTKY